MTSEGQSIANGDEADALFALQLRVARKADEFVRRQGGSDQGLNLHCWLLAEAEVLGHVPSQAPVPRLSPRTEGT